MVAGVLGVEGAMTGVAIWAVERTYAAWHSSLDEESLQLLSSCTSGGSVISVLLVVGRDGGDPGASPHSCMKRCRMMDDCVGVEPPKAF